MARHPDLTDDLRSFFHNRDAMDALARPLHDAAGKLPSGDAPTIAHLPGNQPAGTRVRYFGDYELLSEIARGGMGVVYKARQVSLNRLVALKMILSGQLASAEDVRRFRQEAEAAANLDHPHIVPIYEIGEHEGQHYFSMKLIEGGSLSQRLKSGPESLSLHAAPKLLATVARAVHHAHQRGLLHRDLKPGNVLLDTAGQPHVTDFGLAKRVESESDLTHSGAVVGTPSYMAPEQACAETQLTTAVDVYSLGVILYELLTGQLPFRGDSVAETLVRVLNDEPASPRSIKPQIDHDLETICLKCLKKEPTRRYDSAAALADELDRWLRGEPIWSRPTSSWERLGKWTRRRPLAASLAGVSLLAAFAIVALFVGLYYNAQLQGTNTRLQEAFQETKQARDAEASQRQRAEVAFTQAEKSLYLNRILLAEREWQADNLDRAEQLLNDCPTHLRDWEWRYLSRQCRNEVFRYEGYAGVVRGMAFRAEGLVVASALEPFSSGAEKSRDLTIASPASDNSPRVLGGQKMPITCAAVSSSGSRIAAAGGYPERVFHSEIRVWDDAEQPVLSVEKYPNVAISMALSHDDSHLALGCDNGTLAVWELPSGREVWTVRAHPQGIFDLTYSADGHYLASRGGDGSVKVWNAATGEEQFSQRCAKGWWMCMDLSLDGKALAAESGASAGDVEVWDVATSTKLRTLHGHNLNIRAVAFSPDGKKLVSAAADRAIKVWDSSTGEELYTIHGHNRDVYRLKFSADGNHLASVGENVKVWNMRLRPEMQILRSPTELLGAAISANSNMVSLDERGKLRHWNVATGETLRELVVDSAKVAAAAFNVDGQRLAFAAQPDGQSARVAVVNAQTGKRISELKSPGTRPGCLALSSDGQRVAAGYNGNVQVWNAADGVLLFDLRGDFRNARSLAFSPDGRRIACGSGSPLPPNVGGKVTVWSLDTGAVLVADKQHTNFVCGLSFRPCSNWIDSADWNGLAKTWDATTGDDVLAQTSTQWAKTLAYSPDGNRLATILGTRVTLRDATTGQEILVFRDPQLQDSRLDPQLAFSPDGHQLFACTGTRTILIWDARPRD